MLDSIFIIVLLFNQAQIHCIQLPNSSKELSSRLACVCFVFLTKCVMPFPDILVVVVLLK